MRWALIVIGVMGLIWGGCKKKKSACQKKCQRLLTCYEETRGAVPNDKAALRRCSRICDSKSKSRYKKAIGRFGKLSCLEFMRQHRAEARFLMESGRAKTGRAGRRGAGRGGSRAGIDPSNHPFPLLRSRPPSDPKKRRGWRSPVQKDVDRVIITRTDETIVLKRSKPGVRAGDVGAWELTKPIGAPADRFAVRNLLNRLERMVVREKATDIGRDQFARHGLEDKRGIRCQVYIGDKVIADMIVGNPQKPKRGAKRGASRSARRGRRGITTLIRKFGTDDVYRVTGSLTYIFKRAASGWRDATVIGVQREDLAKLSLTLTSGQIVLKRDATETNSRKRFTNWELVSSKPELKTLDQSAITRLVSLLTRLRATSFVSKSTPEETGLDKPRGIIELTDKDGKVTILLVGAKDGKKRAAFAQIKGDKRVFLVRHPLDDLPDQPISNYKDKRLINALAGEINSILIEKNSETVKFTKVGRVWKADEPADLTFDRNKLMGSVRMLEGRFSAHRFATKTDPAATGLSKPGGRIVVTVAVPKKPVVTVEVLIGRVGPRGDFYVQIKGKPQVYLVRKWVLNRIYRGPREWARRNPRGRPKR
jgi:Domain of unknown function (DUF4340)